MLQTKEYKIKSCDDVELDIKRESLLEFSLTFDDEKEIEAILFIIPGLGADNNQIYQNKLALHCANTFSVAVCSVAYHCIANRPQIGCTLGFDDVDEFVFNEICKSLNLKIPKKFLPIKKIKNNEIIELSRYLDEKIQKKKEKFELEKSYNMNITSTFFPAKNEYNNFGIMSATDIVNALLHIKKDPPFKIANGGGHLEDLKTIFLGSSHGGYLANLVAKISPWNVDFVIDNSSYVKIPWRLIGFGKEIDYVKYPSCSIRLGKNISSFIFDKTLWTTNKFSKNYFSKSRERIRTILDEEHIKIQAEIFKTKYISYHSRFDGELAPAADKELCYALFKQYGYDAKLFMIESEEQIDGKFIKKLTHGLGMSIKTLINNTIPFALTQKSDRKNLKKEISYPCNEYIYTFKEKDNVLQLECKKI